MVLAVFVDGLGLADADHGTNPTMDGDLAVLPSLLRTATPLDATMGMDGLPQSATGQAALFTGLNTASLVGRHHQGFAGPTLRRLLVRGTFYTRAREAGGRVAFLNTYSRKYLRLLASGHLRVSCSTLAAVAAGLPLRDSLSLRRGNGLYHDLTGDGLLAQGEDVPRMLPGDAAAVALRVAAAYDLTVFEYFITDPAGHSGEVDCAREVLARLDTFLAAVIDGLASQPGRLVLFSDHGNIEDMSSTQHTRNPVPLVVWPPNDAAGACGCVSDVADLLVMLATDAATLRSPEGRPGYGRKDAQDP